MLPMSKLVKTHLYITLSYYRSNRNSRIKNLDVYRCKVCKGYHPLRLCPRFLRMEYRERNRVVRKYDYCINCLASSHTFRRCQSKNTCQRCQHYHHTLLHSSPPPRIMPPSRRQQNPRQRVKAYKPKRVKEHFQHAAPDQRILSEAIRSLAIVLCASTPTRRHV